MPIVYIGDGYAGDPASLYWKYVVGDFIYNAALTWVSPVSGSSGDTIVLESNRTHHQIEVTGSFVFNLGNPGSVVGTVTSVMVTDQHGDTIILAADLDYTWQYLTDDPTLAGIQAAFRALGGDWYGNSGADVLYGAAGNDKLYGGGGSDRLSGNGGDDWLYGEEGADTMAGGAGSDAYFVDNIGDRVSESANGGLDAVASSVTFTLPPNVETLALLDGASIDGTGNAGDNWILGNSGNNRLFGAGGDDHLKGGEGDDVLDGGPGADELIGDAGDDTYVLDNPLDTVEDESGVDIILVRFNATPATILLDLTDLPIEDLIALGSGAFSLIGNASDNLLKGNAAANMLDGGDGDDWLDGGAGADTMWGGLGNDMYVLNVLADIAVELQGEGNDTLIVSFNASLLDVKYNNFENLTLAGTAVSATGDAGANLLAGTAAANTLDGGAGADILAGQAGNDTYVVDSDDDDVIEVAGPAGGVDLVRSWVNVSLWDDVEHVLLLGSGALNVIGNALGNTITGNAGANDLSGLDGNDRLVGEAGNDILRGGVGNDVMLGGAGSDTYYVDSFRDAVTETLAASAGGGTDDVISSVNFVLGANVENLTLVSAIGLIGTGNSLDNHIVGSDGKDVLLGGAGNDRLAGGDGADTLDGGAGLDQFDGGAGNDVFVLDNPLETISDSAGNDTVQIRFNATPASMVLDLTAPGYAAAEDLIVLGSGAFSLIGNASNNVLKGNAGANVLDGGAGDDWLDGGAGVDSMSGGLGNDTYVLNVPADIVVELPGGGTDTIIALFNASLLDAKYDNFENLTLAGTAVSASGDAGVNLLIGNAAANTLDGGAGADTLRGGAGNDTYVVDSAGDQVIELAGGPAGGVDLVRSWVNVSLWDDVEHVLLLGSGALNVIGNALGNTITGNAGANDLSGLDGNDRLVGEAGNDILRGGVGNDVMLGGAGSDTYYVDSFRDAVTETLAASAGGGTDDVISSVNFVLGANVENLTLVSAIGLIGTGNSLDNHIVGSDGKDVLLGGAGNDRLAGGDGADTLDGGAGLDQFDGGAGNDVFVLDNPLETISDSAGDDTVQIRFNATPATMVLDLTVPGYAAAEDLIVLGSGAFRLVGNASGNTLKGNAAANVLDGGAGNDWLDGGAGVDTMSGGMGNDTYVLNVVADIAVELQGEGNDTLIVSFNASLLDAKYDNFENLTLAGTAVSATGDAGANLLTGNAAANTLDGGPGADTLTGGAGNDLYKVDDAGDTVIELAGQGVDRVEASVSYALAPDVENLTLTGVGNIDASGNTLANTMLGNPGNNALAGGGGADNLTGGAGDDTLAGGEGNDTLTGGAGADAFAFDTSPGAGNIDRITDFSAAAGDHIQFDADIYSALGAPGALTAAMFRAGARLTTATDADDHILLNTSTGVLYYDADGAGGAAALQIATIVGVAGITAASFEVIS